MHTYSEFRHMGHAHLQKLMECFAICSACAKMCVDEGHKTTAKLCYDCADICGLTIKFHSGDSEFNQEILQVCSSVCARCAEACSKVHAKHCQQCSQACHACAEACKTAIV